MFLYFVDVIVILHNILLWVSFSTAADEIAVIVSLLGFLFFDPLGTMAPLAFRVQYVKWGPSRRGPTARLI